MQRRFNTRASRFVLSTLMLALLAACGGGGSSSDGVSGSTATGSATSSDASTSASNKSITLSGQVVDSAVSGAQVCIFSNGVQARNAAGDAICSGQTDAQGNYSMTIPQSLASGFLTLVATKGSDIKLTSTLGTLDQVLSVAGSAGTVTSSSLSSATITHLTTADFALADTNHDGTVSQDELNAYKPDLSKVAKAATLIKAYIDGGQTSLIGGQTTDTLALASAAVQNKPLGSTNQTADDWFDDPAHVQAISTLTDVNDALNADLAKEMAGKFSKYQLTDTVTRQTIPPTVTANGGAASIYCTSDRTVNVPVTFNIEIAFDAARSIALVRYTNDEGKLAFIKGNYNTQTGDFSLYEIDPKRISQTGTVTYYSEGYVKYDGKIDASGNISGAMQDSWTNTWSLDSTRQTCVDAGNFTIIKQ